MITQKQIDTLRGCDGYGWIGALRPDAIAKLVRDETIQMHLFDERNLYELTQHPDFPDERLVACRNATLAKRRAGKRQSLIDATTEALRVVQRMVERNRVQGKQEIGDRARKILSKYKIGAHFKLDIRDDGFDFDIDRDKVLTEATANCKTPQMAAKRHDRIRRHIDNIVAQLQKLQSRVGLGELHGKDRIGLRVGKVINKYRMAKHFDLDIGDNAFHFKVNQQRVADEAALDGIYVVRTSLPERRMSADDTVRSYKQLSNVERAFRSIKTVDLMVRPIRHHLEHRVRAHIFLCMLAYYIQWHMVEAWRPLLFGDEDHMAKQLRDPVAPAKRSEGALSKVHTRHLDDGNVVHSFQTLLQNMSSIVRNTCRIKDDDGSASTFEIVTTPNTHQRRVLELLDTISV